MDKKEFENTNLKELLKDEEFMKKYNEFKAKMEYTKYMNNQTAKERDNAKKQGSGLVQKITPEMYEEARKRNKEIMDFCANLKNFDGKSNEDKVLIFLTALPPELTFLLEHTITGDVFEGEVDIEEELDKFEDDRWPDLSHSATGELSNILKKCENKQEEVINYLRSNDYQKEKGQKLLEDIQNLTEELYSVFDLYSKSNNNSIKM